MSTIVPTVSECLAATQRIPLQHLKDRKGKPRWHTYSVSVPQYVSDASSPDGFVARGRTSVSCPQVLLGALLIAAKMDIELVNAAIAYSVKLIWNEKSDVPLSRRARGNALLLLRAGWTPDAADEVKHAIENNAAQTQSEGITHDEDLVELIIEEIEADLEEMHAKSLNEQWEQA